MFLVMIIACEWGEAENRNSTRLLSGRSIEDSTCQRAQGEAHERRFDLMGGVWSRRHSNGEKLRRWFTLRQNPLPPFLEEDDCARLVANLEKVRQLDSLQSTRGRPQKAAWRNITKALLELRTEKPNLPKKMLAYEARKRAAQEFDESDLSSVATIQRKMGEIFRSKGH